MRVLVVGAHLAGLLSARHLRQQGHEVTLLVEGPEVATQAMPPFVFSDPGPWGAAQGALSTLGAMLKDCRELRLGLDGLAYSGWLAHCIGRRFGGRARSQALQALAMARRSQIVFDQLTATAALPGTLETVSMLSLYRDGHLAEAHSQRGPMWHLGSPPKLCDTAAITALLPQLDRASVQLSSGLQSQGQMLADAAALMAALRQQLVNAGVRFIFDHQIDGAVHAGQHLHAVTLRGRLGLTEELDTDMAVATSRPLAQPLLRALGFGPTTGPPHAMAPQGPTGRRQRRHSVGARPAQRRAPDAPWPRPLGARPSLAGSARWQPEPRACPSQRSHHAALRPALVCGGRSALGADSLGGARRLALGQPHLHPQSLAQSRALQRPADVCVRRPGIARQPAASRPTLGQDPCPAPVLVREPSATARRP